MVEERFDDFPIYELKNYLPLVNQSNIGTQGSHEGCVLEANHSGPHHDDLFRQTTQVAKVICVHNVMVVKGNLRAVRGSRAASNQDLRRFESNPFAVALNFHSMGI